MSKLSEIVETELTARADIRRHLGLEESDILRVAYLPGPGDVAGTFRHWFTGQHEPRVPIVAYSLMFYELMEQIDAHSLIISLQPVGNMENYSHERFLFQEVFPITVKGRLSYFWSQRQFARAIISAINRYDPHIVVTSTHNPSASWKHLSKSRKLVLTAHNTFWPQGRPPKHVLGRWRRGLLASRAKALDAAICTSHECARQISELTDNRVQFDVECPQIISRYALEQRSKLCKLLFLGRIEKDKGIFLLLDVFEQIANQYADLTLTFAGSGGAEGALKKRLAQSPFSNRIAFLGRVDSEGVHTAIAASDLVVCPTMTSFNEGLAVVGFEAAAHGIPTLVSSVVPAAQLLGDSCTVYQADDAQSLRVALCSLMENELSYRDRCLATAAVRELIYDRSLSWGSGLFRAMMLS